MFSPALARRSAGSGRGGPVPFKHLWPVLREELARVHRARAGAGAARPPAALVVNRDCAVGGPSREGVAGCVAP